MRMMISAGEGIFIGQYCNELLQVGGWSEIFTHAFKQAVMAAFETEEPHIVKFTESKRQIQFQIAVRDSHVFQILFEPVCIFYVAVQRRSTLRAQPGHWKIDQSIVRNKIAAHAKQTRKGVIDPLRAVRSNRIPKNSQMCFSLPVAPQHSQVRVIEFVWEEAKCAFRVEIRESQPVRCGRVSANK